MPIDIDLSKLPAAPWGSKLLAAPWSSEPGWLYDPIVLALVQQPDGSCSNVTICRINRECPLTEEGADDIAKFIVVARNAFAGHPESLAWWEANRKEVK